MDFNLKNLSQVQLVSAAAVVIIIAGAIGFWLGGRNSSNPSKDATATVANSLNFAPPPPSMTEENSISIKDQAAGLGVLVDALTLTRDGWVVVHEDRNGAPGNILGAQWLPAGSHTRVAVDLLRTMESGASYYAMLHTDDGDHQLDRAKDLPINGSDGAPISLEFRTTTGK